MSNTDGVFRTLDIGAGQKDFCSNEIRYLFTLQTFSFTPSWPPVHINLYWSTEEHMPSTSPTQPTEWSGVNCAGDHTLFSPNCTYHNELYFPSFKLQKRNI